MNTQIFYRLVDSKYEPIGSIIDTDTAQMPTRMKKTVELFPLFNILLPFWLESKVQLDTACNCMLEMYNYLESVQRIESQGGTSVPTAYINKDEQLSDIPLITLKKIMLSYYDYYNETGISMNYDDLQYIWEYLWSVVRKNFYPNKLDRFASIFLFDSIEQTKNFQEMVDPMHNRVICTVELINTKSLEKYDMKWLDNVPTNCTFEEMVQYALSYWEGKMTSIPIAEYLFSGSYILKK